MKIINHVILISMLALSPMAWSQTQKTQPAENKVYITKTGSKYHLGSCSYLRHSRIEIKRSDAIDQEYTACSRCKPGSETTAKTSKKLQKSISRCQAITKKGTQCKRAPSKGGSYCWQHG